MLAMSLTASVVVVVVVVCGVFVLFLVSCGCGGRWCEGVGGWLGGLGLLNVPTPRWPRDDVQP